jgi:hypothetical protein
VTPSARRHEVSIDLITEPDECHVIVLPYDTGCHSRGLLSHETIRRGECVSLARLNAVFLSNAIGTPPIVLGFVLEHRGQTHE